jgi:hypothetical protein
LFLVFLFAEEGEKSFLDFWLEILRFLEWARHADRRQMTVCLNWSWMGPRWREKHYHCPTPGSEGLTVEVWYKPPF